MDKEPVEPSFDQASLVDKLINSNLVSPKEIENANAQQMDYLVARAQEILSRVNTDFDQRGKIESILDIGLSERMSRLESVVRTTIFAVYLHLKYPSHITGVVLFGSQKKGSDRDLFIFTKPGIVLPGLEMPLDFEDTIEKASKNIFKAPIDGHFFLGNLDTMTPEEAESNYPVIAKNAVAVFTNKNIGDKFKRIFGPQMNKPQNLKMKSITQLGHL